MLRHILCEGSRAFAKVLSLERGPMGRHGHWWAAGWVVMVDLSCARPTWGLQSTHLDAHAHPRAGIPALSPYASGPYGIWLSRSLSGPRSGLPWPGRAVRHVPALSRGARADAARRSRGFTINQRRSAGPGRRIRRPPSCLHHRHGRVPWAGRSDQERLCRQWGVVAYAGLLMSSRGAAPLAR